MNRVKNSLGIWAFGSLATRFLPGGYHPEAEKLGMVPRVEQIAAGLGSLVDGYEFHYPGEINEANVAELQRVLGDRDIYAVASGLHTDPKFARGAFTHPDKRIRKAALTRTRKAIDLAGDIGAKFIIWPGGEGYNYPFQADYDRVWDNFIACLAESVEHANDKGVTVLLEHKNSEPAMKILMRNIGMTIFVIRKLEKMGVDTSQVKVNMDWQHLIMNGESLAEYAALLHQEDLLGHQHGNSGWGIFDDDNIVGATRFMETLELAVELRRINYGSRGERIGFDIFPYTEEPIQAARQCVLQWEFIDSLAAKVDQDALFQAREKKDALKGLAVVFEALGLNRKFVADTLRSRVRGA